MRPAPRPKARAQGDATSAAAHPDWAQDRMPCFQMPRYLAFIEAFEKTPTQRISKADLSRSTANADQAPEVGRRG